MRYLFSLLLAILFTFLPHASEGEQYRDSTYGFTIDFPDGWAISGPSSDKSIIIKAKRFAEGAESMIAQVIVRGGVYVGDRNLSDLSPKELFDETIGDKGMLVDSGFETICGERIPWLKVVFRQSVFFKTANSCGVFYFIKRGDRFYQVEGVTMGESGSWFAENESVMRNAIRSFR
jgi:hypothetical protein